jgi:hypothetical protein
MVVAPNGRAGLAVRCWTEQLGRPPTLDDLTVRSGEAFLDWLHRRNRLTRWHGELATYEAAIRIEAVPRRDQQD